MNLKGILEMDKKQVLEIVNKIFREVFDDSTLCIQNETTAQDIEDWDSLTHLELIAEIESVFTVTFTLGEINTFVNVGEMCECIEKHLNK